MRARVLSSLPIGSCTPLIPRGPHSIPQGPIGVSNKVKCWLVMAGSDFARPMCNLELESRLGNCCDPPGFRGIFRAIPRFSSFRGASETSEPGISRFRVWSVRVGLADLDGPSRNDAKLWAGAAFRGIISRTPPPHPTEPPNANDKRQRIRHGLSRGGPGNGSAPAAGLRARLALRLPHLVVGAGTAQHKTSRDRGVVAAFLPRSLGRRR